MDKFEASIAAIDEARRSIELKALRRNGDAHTGDVDGLVHVVTGGLAQAVKDMDRYLSGILFHRGDTLVRILRADEAAMTGDEDEIRRAAEQPVIVPVSTDALRVIAADAVRFISLDAKGNERPVDCPPAYARALLAIGLWRYIPRLTAIATSPTIRSDGTIVQRRGYDPASGLYLAIDDAWPMVPEAPSRDDARASMAELMGPFAEFPFQDGAARSALLSALLTRIARPTLPTAPAHWFVAPAAGSGKSLLADAVAIIAAGVTSAKRAWPRDEEEMRKAITACLLAGDPMITFDNIPRGQQIRSAALDAALTTAIWSDRVLGVSRNVALPFDAFVTITGNNIVPYGDTVRRGIYCTIVPDVERPETRTFTIPDLAAHLHRDRRRLLVAALTIMAAHRAAGSPEMTTALGSFEAWSRRVRDPIVWLGMPDPVSTQEAMHSENEEGADLADLLVALRQEFGTVAFRAAQVHGVCYPPVGDANVALRQAIEGEKPRQVSVRGIGRRLTSHAKRVRGGLRLVAKIDQHDKVSTFRIEEVGP